MSKDLKIVMTTMPSEEDGKILAEKLVRNYLVECAKVSPVTSFYVWENKLVRDHESLLLLVVQDDKVRQLENFIRENHPYSIPEFIVLNCDHVSENYLGWAFSSKLISSTD